MMTALIEASQLQRKALKLSRYAAMDENGAYALNDAADALMTAALRLREVSAELLQARAQARKCAA